MSKSYWLLVTDPRKPGSVIHHYMNDAQLAQLRIAGKVGDEFKMFGDDKTKYRIVGKLDTAATRFLDATVQFMDAASFDAGEASQGVRYEIIEGIVRSVMQAAKRAAELPRTKA